MRQSFNESAVACGSQRSLQAPANELTPVAPWPFLRADRCFALLPFQRDIDVAQFAGLVSEPCSLPAQCRPGRIADSRSKETDGRAQARQRNAHRMQGRGVAAGGSAAMALQIREAAARDRLQRHGARGPHV
jgi:hypothetical protein